MSNNQKKRCLKRILYISIIAIIIVLFFLAGHALDKTNTITPNKESVEQPLKEYVTLANGDRIELEELHHRIQSYMKSVLRRPEAYISCEFAGIMPLKNKSGFHIAHVCLVECDDRGRGRPQFLTFHFDNYGNIIDFEEGIYPNTELYEYQRKTIEISGKQIEAMEGNGHIIIDQE